MNYELAKKLKDAGYEQKIHHAILVQLCVHGVHNFGHSCDCKDEDYIYTPNLSELIEACGDRFQMFFRGSNGKWTAATTDMLFVHGSNPEEAVVLLWLELNKKK